jgi:carboxylesterase type B
VFTFRDPSIDAFTRAEVIVQTSGGKVSGIKEGEISYFLGIPYAAAPFGANRFRAPVPASWGDDVLNADTFGSTAPQIPVPDPFSRIIYEPVIPGEDCLNVNVWTPDVGGSGLPVMVWIHGGAFRTGSNAVPTYDGSAFARDGVVFVSINYRLGVEGFADLPGAPRNRGLLDQLFALEWVQENIAAFGGDPTRVTVAGESAGAMSVTTLLSLDRGGLFHQAIMQSGAGHCAQDIDDAALVTGELGKRLGVVGQLTAETLAQFELDRILTVQTEISDMVATSPDKETWGETTVMSGMAFLPIIDDDLLTQRPIDAIAAGAGENVPVLTGTNTQEYRLFTAPIGAFLVLDPKPFKDKLTAYGIESAVPGVYDFYKGHLPSDTRPAGIFSAIASDFFFRIPACRVAEARAAAPATTHVYEFDWRSPRRILGTLADLGACHALELGFTFDTLSETSSITDPNPPQGLATAMHAAWVDFVKSGDPGWIRHQISDDPAAAPEIIRAVQTFFGATEDETKIDIINDPRAHERELWKDFVTP